MTEMRKTLGYITKVTAENKPSLFILYIVMLIADVTVRFTELFFSKCLIDEIVAIGKGAAIQHVHTAILYIGLMISIQFIMKLLNAGCGHLKTVYGEWFNEYFEVTLAEYAMRLDYQHTEDPVVLNQISKARDGISWYSGGVVGILDSVYEIIMNMIVLAGVSFIILWTCPIVIPIQLVSLFIVFYCNRKRNEMKVGFFKDLSKYNRVCEYVFYQLAEPSYGKDIRLYGSQDLMKEKAQKYANRLIAVWSKLGKKQRVNSWCVDIVNALRDGATILCIGLLALKKEITIGDFSLCIASATSVYWSLSDIMGGWQEIEKKCTYAYQFLVFLEYPNAMKDGKDEVEKGSHEIEFKHVSFRYPRTDQDVLKDINIKIHQGEHLSIVGKNGSGKTTFIKLLCRLYDVTEGQILVDGKDIRDYSMEEYRSLLAVIFQDYKLFAFSIKDNICAGTTEAGDQKMVEVLKKAGLSDTMDRLKQGTDTILYKSFDKNGTELSGGEMQKVAIARALYKDAPIVILDEPTAALDPIAEYEVYRSFDELVGEKTAIYISHRLSSCRFCDKIAVFDEGMIKEYGTHEELMAIRNGLYESMFKTQAQNYV